MNNPLIDFRVRAKPPNTEPQANALVKAARPKSSLIAPARPNPLIHNPGMQEQEPSTLEAVGNILIFPVVWLAMF